jgi:hypothetical protein
MKHIVIDLETLGLSPDSIILSIGAVATNGEKFYMELDWREQQHHRKVDPITCMWWGQQDKDLCPIKGETLLYDALNDLSLWLPDDKESFKIWCRGLNFDIAVLDHAYKEYHLPTPWKYNHVRDIRTALDIIQPQTLAEPKRKHHALDDAIADMWNLVNAGIVSLDDGVLEL